MAFEFSPDVPSLLADLQRFMVMHGRDLPEETFEQLLPHTSNPQVSDLVFAAEALYAIKGELTKEGRDITAKLAQFCAYNGWHGMGERGYQIAAAMQRIGGYQPPPGQSWPKAEDDPEPLARFVEEQPAPAQLPPVE